MATTYLSWTPSATPTGAAKKFTFSAWLKFNKVNPGMIMVAGSSANSYCLFGAYGSGKFTLLTYTGYVINFTTPRLFRDLNCFYHVVLACDTNQASATDAVKLYVNNELQTFSLGAVGGETGYTQNTSLRFGTNGELITIGRNGHQSQHYFDGVMSYVAFVDGQQLTPSTFGEADSLSGEWKIKTTITPGGTGWGTNGFFILKDGNSVTDQSGNGNNFAVTAGSLTSTLESPSNVYCTFNKLYNTNANNDLVPAVTLGSTMLSGHGSGWFQIPGTLAFNKGKFYWECKFNAGTNLDKNTPGVIDYEKCFGTGQFQDQTGSVFYKNEDGGETRLDGTTSSADYGTLAQNDILGVAVDMDAATPTVKFYKNGSLLVTVNASSLSGKFVTPANTVYASGEYQVNFGGGHFGTTAISTNSGNGYAGAEGSSKFNYQPPTGYSALSTKGLNE